MLIGTAGGRLGLGTDDVCGASWRCVCRVLLLMEGVLWGAELMRGVLVLCEEELMGGVLVLWGRS